MNILQLNTSFDKGGAAQIARIIHKNINEKSDHNSLFAYGRGEKIIDMKVYEFSYELEYIYTD